MKRITLFSGHYGSGKTNLAVNYALKLANEGKKVAVYDMDIVNPYYRTLDAKSMLDDKGVHLVVSGYANSNVDVPAVTAEAYAMVDDKSAYAVVDIGGDDRGALVLGRYADAIKEENDYEFVFVLNKFRPETRDMEGAIEVYNEIENVSKIKFTAIASNGNVGKETTESDVIEGLEFSEKFSRRVGLPIVLVGVEENLFKSCSKEIKNVLPMKMIKYLNF